MIEEEPPKQSSEPAAGDAASVARDDVVDETDVAREKSVAAAAPNGGTYGDTYGDTYNADPSPAAEDGPTSPVRRAPLASPWLVGTSPRELGVIEQRLRRAVVTSALVTSIVVGLWGVSKLAWRDEPLVGQRFRPAEISTLGNRPQNAALEFHHDLVTGQFGQARLLVVETAEKLVEDAAAACQSHAPCGSGERVFTRSTLLRSQGTNATAYVESFTKDGTRVSDGTYELSHESGQWLVTRRN